MPAVLTIATCSIQWFILGYTLAYGEGGWFFGDFKYLFHRGVLAEPVGTIPAILFSEFQLVFEATVCAIAVGGVCERGRLWPLVTFIFVSYISSRGWGTQLYSHGRMDPSSGPLWYTAPWRIWSGEEASSAQTSACWISPEVRRTRGPLVTPRTPFALIPCCHVLPRSGS